MPLYCLDASVILAWLLEESLPLVDDFWASITADDEFIGAELLRSECTSVIRSAEFEGRIGIGQARQLVDILLSLPLRIISSGTQFPRALELAQRFQSKKAYDMHYLATAETEGVLLVTVDRGLRHAARETGIPVRYLR